MAEKISKIRNMLLFQQVLSKYSVLANKNQTKIKLQRLGAFSEKVRLSIKYKPLSRLCAAFCCCGVVHFACKFWAFSTTEYEAYIKKLFPMVYSLDKKYSRANFNPIADVVETAAPAVVFIENNINVAYHGIGGTKGGSGFIIREDGLILTNAHVVDRSNHIIVRLHNGQKYKGTVQALDVVSDLATIRINAKNLPTIKLGDSETLRTGEYVMALGSPLSLSNTVTAGIVSTPKRNSGELGLHGKNIDYIQTDAVINFGNSGGPLINMDGEAVGVNAMKATTGISFAIPSDYVKQFLAKAKSIEDRQAQTTGTRNQSISSRHQSNRRYIGVTMLSLTPSILQDIRTITSQFPAVEHGVLIQAVVVGGPAHQAGIVPGAIITKINDRDITSSAELYNAIASNSKLKLHIWQPGASNIYEQKNIILQTGDSL